MFEGFVAELALVFADVCVDERVLSELLRRRKRLETVSTLVRFLLQSVDVFRVTLQLSFPFELLSNLETSLSHDRKNPDRLKIFH